MGKAVS